MYSTRLRGFLVFETILALTVAMAGCSERNPDGETPDGTLAEWPAERAVDRLPLEVCHREGIAEPLLCGTLDVPLNRAVPDGPSLGLSVVVIPALQDFSGIAWTDHQGGPGFGLLDSARLFQVGGRLEAFRRNRDVMIFDQRGVGESGGVYCEALRPNPILRKRFPPALVRDCRDELDASGLDLRHYSTREAVDDLEAIRAWLGYEQLDIGGWSYGSRFMLTYMQRHADHVRTATLVVPTPIDYRRPIDWARFGEAAYNGLAATCLADPVCAAAIPDPKEDLARLANRLEAEPITRRITHPETGQRFTARVDRNVLSEQIWQAMLSTAGARKLPWLIHRAAAGDVEPLIAEYTPTEPGDLWSEPIYLSVVCPEEVAHIQPEEIDTAVAGTVIGRYYVDAWIEACRIWDLPPAPGTPSQAKELSIPTLVLTGEFDPVALPEYGVRITRNLSQSLHATVPGQGHYGGDMTNQECLDGLILRFIEQGSVKDLDPSCLATMKPPPFETGTLP